MSTQLSSQLSNRTPVRANAIKSATRIRGLYALLVLLLELPVTWLSYLYFTAQGLSGITVCISMLVTGLITFGAFNGVLLICLLSDPDFR